MSFKSLIRILTFEGGGVGLGFRGIAVSTDDSITNLATF